MIFTKRALLEIKAHRLNEIPEYEKALCYYDNAYTKRPPFGTACHNMVRALRLMTWLNTPEDWARLHTTEAFLKKGRTQ